MIPMKREPGGPARSAASSRPEIHHRYETEDEPALLAGIQLSQRQLELQSRRQLGQLGQQQQQQRQRSHSSVNHPYASQQPLTSLSLQQRRDDVASSLFDPPATTGGRKNQKDHAAAAVPVMDNNNGSRRSFLGRKTSPKAETDSSNHNILRAAVAATTSRISPRTVGSGSTVSGHHRFSSSRGGGGGVAAAARPRPHSSPRGEQNGDVLPEDSDTARQYAIIRSFKSKSTTSRGSHHDTNNHNSGSTTLKDHHKNNNNNGGGTTTGNLLQNVLKRALETSKARPKDRHHRPMHRADPPATAAANGGPAAAVAAMTRQQRVETVLEALAEPPPPRPRTAATTSSSSIMEVREKEHRSRVPPQAHATPFRTTGPGKEFSEPSGAHVTQMAAETRNHHNGKPDVVREEERNVTSNDDGSRDKYRRFVKQLSDEVSGSHSYLAASMKTAVSGIPQPVRVGQPTKMDEPTRDRVSHMNKFLVTIHCDRADDKEKQTVNDRAYDRERKKLGKPIFSTENLLTTVPSSKAQRSSLVHPPRQPPILADHHDRQSLPAPATVSRKISAIQQTRPMAVEPKQPIRVEPKPVVPTVPIQPPVPDSASDTISCGVDHASESILAGEPIKPTKEKTTGQQDAEPPLFGQQRTISKPSTLSTAAPDVKSGTLSKPLVLNKALRSVKLPSPPSAPAAPEWMKVNLKPVKRDRPPPQPEEPISVPLTTKLPGATAEHPIIVDAVTDIIPEVPMIVADKEPVAATTMVTRITTAVPPPDRNQRLLPPPKTKFADYPEDDTVLLLPLQHDNGESRILLGKQTIKNIQGALDGKPIEDAIVNWSIDRNEIEPDGINLSMAIFCIILLLTNGEQVEILFQNSDDCVRFVSAYYDVTSVPPEVSDSTSVNSSVRGLESLNDEEQSVLERYRELRQTKPPMKALAETLSEECDPSPVKPPGLFDARHGLLQQLLLQKSTSSDNEGTTTTDTDASKNGFPEVVSAPDLPSSPVSTFTTATSEGFKSCLAALSDEERDIAKKYDLMLKRGVPIEAVQHSLTKDGIDSKIVDFVLSEAGATKVDNENEHDNIIKKYKQMTKMGIPIEAVRHKMVKDGMDEPTMAIVLKALDVTEAVKAENAPVTLPSRKNKLSPSEEIEVAKYRKLLKLQVSREALLSRMQNEKADDKIIEAVLGKFALNQTKTKKLDDESTSSKLINLHWNPMDDVPAGSVWEQGQSSLDLEKSDINSLVEQFQKKPASSRQGPEPTDKPNYTVKAKILDVTRANNVAISLKAFKDFSYKELAEIIGFLDPCRKILGERAQFVRDLLPTAQEAAMIAKYDGPDDRMGPAEQWFRRLEGIKRLDTKAQVIRTMEFFSSEASEIRNNFRLLSQVCSQIQRSTKLVDVLKMVLKIGNTMNEGTRSGGAAGFRFDSLLRLTQTKTTDGKMSVLDYMVSVFVEKGQREKLDLLSDFPELHAASRFLIVDMQNEVKTLGEALALCKEEHMAMAGDLENNSQRPELNKTVQPSAGDAKKALLESIVAQGEKAAGLQKSEQFTKRDDFLAAIDTKRKVSEDVASDSGSRRTSNSRIENNFQGGMSRLRQFIDSVDDSFARLVKQKDEALECSRDLAKYCGEGGGVGATGSLLDILSKFTRNVESALRSFDERQVRLSTKKKLDDSRQSLDEHSMDIPHPDGRSLILMVNDVLKSANPSFKEDFKKGRKLLNPSDTLKAIYEKETSLRSFGANRESVGSGEENSCCSVTLAVTASTEDSTLQSMSLHTPTNTVPSPTNTEVIGAALEVIRSRAAIEQSSLHKSDEGISNSVSLSARALQKRQQRTMTSPSTIDDEALTEKANSCESSTARLARMKRIQKRLGS